MTAASVDPVSAASLAATAGNTASAAPAMSDLSLFGLFLQADWVVKAVIIVLVLASFWCWAIIVEKWMVMRNAKARARAFENEFWNSDGLDKLHERVKKRGSQHPMATMFTAAMDEWQRSKTAAPATTSFSMQPGSLRAGSRERVVQIMQVARNRELDRLEAGLGFLATTGSSAPFIGLFGTVWGIMHSFHSIAMTKNTSLAAVAPGIAEALFATAIGLLAAIPAVIFYNKISHDIAQFSGRMEDFGTEFGTILSRQMEG